MIFATFQSPDFIDKPVLAEDEKLPEGLFKGDVSKGVVWCVPITKNFVDSVVNTWMCCPNFSLCFNIFEAEEYHKIDKVAWYKALANDEDIEFWELINDDLDDNHAEYVVPYSAMINGMMKSFGIVNLMDDEDEYNTQLSVYPAETESYVIEEHQEIFLFAQRYFFEMFGSGAPVIKGEIPEPTDLMKHRWISQLLYRSFSLFYLPFIYSGVINTLLAKDKSEMVEYMTGWKLYADIFRSTFTDLENEFSNWSYDKNLTVEGYDLVREKFKNFFLYDKKILQARAEGLGRNEPCPCGSGKKFKKCCGKGYC